MKRCMYGFIGVIVILVFAHTSAARSIQRGLRAHYILTQDNGKNDFNNILWQELGSTNNIPWDKIDILYIAFARVTPDQNVLLQTTDNSNPVTELDRLKSLVISRNTLSPNTRLILSLGGWCNSGNPTNTFRYLYTDNTIDDNKIAIFSRNLVAYIKQYQLDGVDIDWEAGESVSDFYVFANIIRNALDDTGQKYFLTVAPLSGVDGNYKDLKYLIDYVNLMSYGNVDLNTYPSFNFPTYKLLGGIHTYDGDGALDESNKIINSKANVVKSKTWAGLFGYNLLNDMYYNTWRITNKINDEMRRYNFFLLFRLIYLGG